MPIDELTNEKLKSQEKQFTLMFEQNTKDHLDIQKTMKDGFKELGDKIDTISNSKANKWVESFLLWAGAIIGAGLLTFLGTLIYKAIIAFN